MRANLFNLWISLGMVLGLLGSAVAWTDQNVKDEDFVKLVFPILLKHLADGSAPTDDQLNTLASWGVDKSEAGQFLERAQFSIQAEVQAMKNAGAQLKPDGRWDLSQFQAQQIAGDPSVEGAARLFLPKDLVDGIKDPTRRSVLVYDGIAFLPQVQATGEIPKTAVADFQKSIQTELQGQQQNTKNYQEKFRDYLLGRLAGVPLSEAQKQTVLSSGVLPQDLEAYLNRAEQAYRSDYDEMAKHGARFTQEKDWDLSGVKFWEISKDPKFESVLLKFIPKAIVDQLKDPNRKAPLLFHGSVFLKNDAVSLSQFNDHLVPDEIKDLTGKREAKIQKIKQDYRTSLQLALKQMLLKLSDQPNDFDSSNDVLIKKSRELLAARKEPIHPQLKPIDQFESFGKKPQELQNSDAAALSSAIQYVNSSVAKFPTSEVASCSLPEAQLAHVSRLRQEMSSLAMKSSFASILLDPTKNASLTRELQDQGSRCADFLKVIYRSGKTLASERILKATQAISEIPFASGVHDNTFFHYTDSDSLIASLHPEMGDRNAAEETLKKEGTFDRINEYLRERAVGAPYLWYKVLYVAEDPISSRGAGRHRIEFDMNPNARVLQADSEVWPEAIRELEGRFPGLKNACNLHWARPPNSQGEFGSDLYIIIAEDSGVDLVDYNARAFGLGSYDGAPVYRHRWFELLNFKNVLQTQIQN